MRKSGKALFMCILLTGSLYGCQGRRYEPVQIETETTVTDTEPVSTADIIRTEVEPVTETAAGPGAEPGSSPAGEIPYTINPAGTTTETRFPAPSGYARVAAEEGSFQAFMRQQELKADGSPVLLYDGSEKYNQNAQAAVFTMPGFERDLQQCADSVMRMYAEYFRSVGAWDKIAFHLTNGFLMDYSTWRDGNRLLVDGNKVSWVKKASFDDSYETFLLYLQYVMMYAGTLSMEDESEPVNIENIQAGDLFIKGGSPGHCVMVTDVAADGNGNYSYLLSQSYMPGQDFHVLKNPLHEKDPWYYTTELEYPLKTPEYVFGEGSFQRWMGFR